MTSQAQRPSPELAGPGPAPKAVEPVGCGQSVRELLPQALTVSYWSPTGLDVAAGAPVLRIQGKRVDGDGHRERFTHDEWFGPVPAETPLAVTVHVPGVGPGTWETTAEVVAPEIATNRRARRRRDAGRQSLLPAGWSWRRWGLHTADASRTTPGPVALARVPGVARGSWAAAVVVGLVLGMLLQQLLLPRLGLDPRWGQVSVAAVAVGALGARWWYRFLHRDRPGSGGGWAVQGFVTGVVLVLALALIVARVPPGPVLDATAPGLLLGLGLGRIGCFFSGCCAGRATRARLGVLASDRRVLIRRVPVQLYEAAAGVALAGAALGALLTSALPEPGAVFAVALALHVLVRQLLLPLRAEARRTARGRVAMMTAALVVIAATAVVVVVPG